MAARRAAAPKHRALNPLAVRRAYHVALQVAPDEETQVLARAIELMFYLKAIARRELYVTPRSEARTNIGLEFAQIRERGVYP
jgi:hypothetical protein